MNKLIPSAFKVRIGPRLIKTGLAVALSMFLVNLTGRPYEIHAGIAATLAVQPTLGQSLKSSEYQAWGNLIGAALGILIALLLGHHPLIVGLAVILVIAMCLRIGLETAISSAVVMTIFVMERQEADYFGFAMGRFGAIMLGGLVGAAVNFFLWRPDHRRQVLEALSEAGEAVDAFGEQVAGRLTDAGSLSKPAIKELARAAYDKIDPAKTALGYYREELGARAAGSDELVLFEKSLNTLYSAVERILDLHRAALEASRHLGHEEPTRLVQVQLRLALELRRRVYSIITATAGGEKKAPDASEYNWLRGQIESRTVGALAQTGKPEDVPLLIAIHNMSEHVDHIVTRVKSLQRMLPG